MGEETSVDEAPESSGRKSETGSSFTGESSPRASSSSTFTVENTARLVREDEPHNTLGGFATVDSDDENKDEHDARDASSGKDDVVNEGITEDSA
mmetsp:Transcript_4279/g.13078  ORF Transcript_4279/g.13078 Transcript_4279/m.13078 type:complete len:95 (-) Transcript_4279:1126-1410(-)